LDKCIHFSDIIGLKLDVNIQFYPKEGFLLSQTVEYALRAVVQLASVAPAPQTTDQIAKITRVPRAYLSKVLQSLGRAKLVHSRRGIGGGIVLSKPANELTILEVVKAVEPIQRIRTCPLGLVAHGTHLCPLHKRLDNALAMVEEAFQHTTLAEVLAEPSPSIPLCPFPNLKLQQKRGRQGMKSVRS
jgi:Rrf2 family nitric oxide-sensitive transcriptional repressor